MATRQEEADFDRTKALDVLMGVTEMMNSDGSYRNEAKNTVLDVVYNGVPGQIVVDTVCPPDTGKWETGVQTPDWPRWCIVEQYASEEAAAAGHDKWVMALTENPEQDLYDVLFTKGGSY